jgi:hypothetical protein
VLRCATQHYTYTDVTFGSCFSHAVAIAEGKFLAKISPTIKKTKTSTQPEDAPMQSTGEVDPKVDDEDTEEEIDALVKEVDDILADLPEGSDQVKLLAGLLLKLRRFIAKVSLKLDCHTVGKC